jgi:hypothetical protein
MLHFLIKLKIKISNLENSITLDQIKYLKYFLYTF